VERTISNSANHQLHSLCVIDERPSLRSGLFGVLPPILEEDAFIISSLELASPTMPGEDQLSKILSHMRLSSDFKHQYIIGLCPYFH
jgi:hypothetical protein